MPLSLALALALALAVQIVRGLPPQVASSRRAQDFEDLFKAELKRLSKDGVP